MNYVNIIVLCILVAVYVVLKQTKSKKSLIESTQNIADEVVFYGTVSWVARDRFHRWWGFSNEPVIVNNRWMVKQSNNSNIVVSVYLGVHIRITDADGVNVSKLLNSIPWQHTAFELSKTITQKIQAS